MSSSHLLTSYLHLFFKPAISLTLIVRSAKNKVIEWLKLSVIREKKVRVALLLKPPFNQTATRHFFPPSNFFSLMSQTKIRLAVITAIFSQEASNRKLVRRRQSCKSFFSQKDAVSGSVGIFGLLFSLCVYSSCFSAAPARNSSTKYDAHYCSCIIFSSFSGCSFSVVVVSKWVLGWYRRFKWEVCVRDEWWRCTKKSKVK